MEAADAGSARSARALITGNTEASPSGASGNARAVVARGVIRAKPSTTPTLANSATSACSRKPIGRRIALVVPTIVRGGRDEIAIGAGGSEDHSLLGRDDANTGALSSLDDA